jgi:hypothetical protein
MADPVDAPVRTQERAGAQALLDLGVGDAVAKRLSARHNSMRLSCDARESTLGCLALLCRPPLRGATDR